MPGQAQIILNDHDSSNAKFGALNNVTLKLRFLDPLPPSHSFVWKSQWRSQGVDGWISTPLSKKNLPKQKNYLKLLGFLN